MKFLSISRRSAVVAKFTKFSVCAVLIAASMPTFAQASGQLQASQTQASGQQVSEKSQVIKKAVWSRVKMDSAYDVPQGKEANSAKAVIEGHRATSPSLLKPVGKCEVDLKGERLYGFVLDQMMDYAVQRLTKNKKGPEVRADLAIVCFRSPEACIAAGDVAPIDIMDLLPFDNQTVILHLEGKYMREFLRHTAQMGALSSLEAGEGAGAGVGVGAGAEAPGATFEDERVYKVITIDCLLKGEFGARMMKQAKKLDNFNMPLCNIVIQNIKKLAQRGETIK